VTVSIEAPRSRISPAAFAGFGAVAAARFLTLPRRLWEMDEVLFSRAVHRFVPLEHRPHPPGYPLFVGLGKVINLALHNAFASLLLLSLIASLVGYWALYAAFRRIAGGSLERDDAERVAIAGALLFHLSPVMWVQGPLPMSDPTALLFVSLALAAAAALRDAADGGGERAALALGAATSAAIGCRPQLALAVLPMLAVALWPIRDWRRRAAALGAFTLVSLLWFLPLLAATGGVRGFLAYQGKQASYVATHDATASRTGAWLSGVAAPFISHPWGPKALALPVLALAAVGATVLVRRRTSAALPLAGLSGAQLAVCLAVMDPADAVRYALPVVLGVAFAAAVGAQALARRAHRPAAAWLAPLLVGTAALAYAWPVLAARVTSLSPPTAAALWAQTHLPPKSIVLVGPDMAPHAVYLLKGFDLVPVEEGFHHAALRPAAAAWLLAEGESRTPGAVTFRWPDSDAYRKLTRNHYRVVSLAPVPAGHRFQALRGVYEWEPSLLDPQWRWLAPDAALRVFPRGARAFALTLALDRAATLPANTVTAAANGVAVPPLILQRGGQGRIELPVPASAASGPVEITIRSASSFVPGGADLRRLGVQLLAVERLPR
jgi:hypothetical protein